MPNPKGRPPKAYRTTQWCVRLPEQLAAKFDLLLVHESKGFIPHEAKQALLSPILDRLWQATLDGDSTILVGDIVASLRSKFTPEQTLP